MQPVYQPDAKLDLTFERIVDVPRELIWQAWTQPEHIKKWFTPAPWQTVDCAIDLRPGGLFSTVMRSPEGQDFPNLGCYLEIIPNEKLVWTNALAPGFRPVAASPAKSEEIDFQFTAMICLATQANATRYTATVIHADEASCQRHAAMGFTDGWGKALDQLVALARTM